MLLAVDPGRRKCGVAVVQESGECLYRAIVEREELLPTLRQYLDRWPIAHLLVGGATGSKLVVQELRALGREVTVVNEFRTSERARGRYFRDHPPRGLWRLVPLGLQVPPVAIDDYAALIMAEDYLDGKRKEQP